MNENVAKGLGISHSKVSFVKVGRLTNFCNSSFLICYFLPGAGQATSNNKGARDSQQLILTNIN